jgi:valyl-tRNA synthetase
MSKLSFHKETFCTVLGGIFKLMHPITPFITDELWRKIGNDQTIMTEAWPTVDKNLINDEVEEHFGILISVIKAIRNIRSEMNVPPSKKADVIILAKNETVARVLSACTNYIQLLGLVQTVDVTDTIVSKPRESSYAAVDAAEIYVPLANLIDIGAEIKRLEKELAKCEGEIDRVKKKLINPSFIDKAPEDVIQAERDKEKAYLEKRKIIAEQLKALT